MRGLARYSATESPLRLEQRISLPPQSAPLPLPSGSECLRRGIAFDSLHVIEIGKVARIAQDANVASGTESQALGGRCEPRVRVDDRTLDDRRPIEAQPSAGTPVMADHRGAPVNALGYLRVMFTVDDLDETLARLGKRAQLIDRVVQYYVATPLYSEPRRKSSQARRTTRAAGVSRKPPVASQGTPRRTR